MKISVGGGKTALQVANRAKELEEIGVDRLNTAKTAHDAFLPLMIAAEHTTKGELATNIVVAFARTPWRSPGSAMISTPIPRPASS